MNSVDDEPALDEAVPGREWVRAALWIVIVLAVALVVFLLVVYLLGGFCGCTTRPPA